MATGGPGHTAEVARGFEGKGTAGSPGAEGHSVDQEGQDVLLP